MPRFRFKCAVFALAGLFLAPISGNSPSCFSLARLKYGGGGDWYANPTSLPNLIQEVRSALGAPICPEEKTVQLLDADLFETPILYMTGHGHVRFSGEEQKILRNFLYHGGLLIADDNYGMHDSFVKEMEALFPEIPLRPVNQKHPIFNSHYAFPQGIPKIHEHDGKPPQLFGMEINGRMAVLHTYESDLGDGWENPEVHNNPPSVRKKALKMGVNIIAWYLGGQKAPQEKGSP